MHRPWASDGVDAHVLLYLCIHPVGGRTHRQFGQGRQVSLGKEGLHGGGDLVLNIDLARAQPLDQFDLVGHLQNGIGLAHSGGRPQEDLEPPTPFFLRLGERASGSGRRSFPVIAISVRRLTLTGRQGECRVKGEVQL